MLKEEYDELAKEQAKIQEWLADNDWKPNKIVTGEWSTDDERWIKYLEDRKIIRKRLDEINEIFKDITI